MQNNVRINAMMIHEARMIIKSLSSLFGATSGPRLRPRAPKQQEMLCVTCVVRVKRKEIKVAQPAVVMHNGTSRCWDHAPSM